MMSLNTRFKSAMLVVMMLTASQVSAMSISNMFTPKKVAALAFIVGLVRLRSKGSNFDYKMSDWSNDVKSLLEDYNIFDIELYHNILNFIDKYVIGRQLSIIDATYRSKNEDGTVITLKRKKCDVKPFGLMGLFDAYVIIQLEKIGEIGKNWDGANAFFARFDDDYIAPKIEKVIVVE
jgi:hypothetical protein